MKDRSDIFGDVKTLLEFYRALGIEGIAVKLKEDEPVIHSRQGGTGDGGVKEKRPAGRSLSAPAFLRPEGKKALLAGLQEELGDCVRCKLSKNRKNIVFGEGNPDARLMFIGEAPGREEDIQGRPFVGEAGMLLTRLIERMGLKRTDVYISNIIKCRPPMNRDPEKDEIATCRPFIEGQIGIIQPKVIVTLGRIALQTLMDNPNIRITAVRGNFFDFKGIPVMPTFHPAYLLRNPKDKWLTWTDAQKVMKKLKEA
jgi:uracil-DNA glycosylase family 4